MLQGAAVSKIAEVGVSCVYADPCFLRQLVPNGTDSRMVFQMHRGAICRRET